MRLSEMWRRYEIWDTKHEFWNNVTAQHIKNAVLIAVVLKILVALLSFFPDKTVTISEGNNVKAVIMARNIFKETPVKIVGLNGHEFEQIKMEYKNVDVYEFETQEVLRLKRSWHMKDGSAQSIYGWKNIAKAGDKVPDDVDTQFQLSYFENNPEKNTVLITSVYKGAEKVSFRQQMSRELTEL